MPEQVFFQCSLPRTGSTLFQNLINQNPDFYASGNNGLLGLLKATNVNYLNSPEFKAQDSAIMQKAFQGFCKSSIHGFYNAITDKKYALDKSRGNFANYKMIRAYYPDPKIVCFVRSIPDIFASLEKLFRNNQHRSSILVDQAAMQGTTTFKRVNIWHQSNLKMMDYFYGNIANGLDKKMLFIKYESFCLHPEKELNRFYNFLNVSPFKHDFNNITQTIKENEDVYEENYPGLLKIRPQLSIVQADVKKILGEDIVAWIKDNYISYDDYFGY